MQMNCNADDRYRHKYKILGRNVDYISLQKIIMEKEMTSISIKGLMKNHRLMSISVIVLSILVSLGTVMIGYLLMELLQVDKVNDSYQLLFNWTIKLLILAVIYTIIRYTTSKLQAKLMKNWIIESKEIISQKITHMNYFDVANTPAGEFVSWYSNDMEKIVSNYFQPFFTIVSNATLAVFSIIAIFYINYILALSTVGLLILMTIFPMFTGRQVSFATDGLSKSQEKYVDKMSGTMMGYEQFKNFNAFTWMREMIHKSNEDVEEKRYTYNIKYAIVQNGMIFLNNIAQIVLIAISVYLINKGVVELGVVLSIVVLSGKFFSSTIGLLETSVQFSSVKGIIDKLVFEDKENKTAYPKEIAKLTAENCKAVLGENEIDIEDVVINKNDKCAITGPSGRGKSTLLKMLLGKVANYEGNLKINHASVDDLKGGDFSDSVTYLTQDPYVFNASIRENICMGENFSDEEIWRAIKLVRAENFIEKLPDGLDTVIENMGKNISGGEKQRIVLARGIIRQNNILILDEALSAIDVDTSNEILEELVKNPLLTLIIISHHLNENQYDKFNKVVKL